ncbi:glycosyltransferase family 4 protein [Thermosulfuriphilus ammonigenes]|uniref:Glycosyltransferase family 4 protein n=1 Tax=Thermosulfuriphilus ammonigenes TaxID=1936021 RepID=A0A6G7PYR4_9BACT|nr:glycosyltransferase [Thermosulfuriphilus ammonigenes]MBA2849523.1 glycosyltransferase involved in cell wall biosynthesis [Thermosulfuriphilus ammonigenes]QIJ72588.1 glycosyltransferase family 4 protein [Thermosulfuriphilus ammonigenes]
MEKASRRLRVLQLGSPTGLYGAERWILALIKYLDPQKVETIVGVIRDDPSLEAPLCREAARLGFKTVFVEAPGRFNLRAISGLRDLVRRQRIDILHTHGYKPDIVGLLALRGLPCRQIATPHGWSKEPDLKLKIYELLNRLTFLGVDKVAPLSEEIYQELARIPGLSSRLRLIRNAVDVSEVDSVKHEAPETRAAREEGAFILGYIGQLIHRKGIDILLKALSSLRGLNFRLFVVGSGPLRERLEEMARDLGLSDRVVFTGYRADRLQLLRGFDLFVLPSRLEGIPRCLMEAMAMGKPVIASDIDGCRALIPNDGIQGLLFPAQDAQALARRIDYLAHHPEEARLMGGRAREFIRIYYSAERMAREYENLYLEVMERSRP